MTSDLHKIQLTEFLKSCRGRLSPADFGLPETARRRTPGLRREDVAVLAGVSVTWYTWLEQGRDVRASARVLENISATLRLTPDERDYLFSLVQSRLAPLAVDRSLEVPQSVQRMIDSLDVPAYVMTMKWDVLAWNWMVSAVFRDFATIPKHRRNMIKILLVDDLRYQADPKEYDAIARRVLSKLRVDYSQSPGDVEFDALIEEMMRTCPIFARLWGSTEIRTRSEGIHGFRHPVLGMIDYEHTSYAIEGRPTLRVVIFAPRDAQSAAKLRRIAAENDIRSAIPDAGGRPPKKIKRPEKKTALV
jgi:transcriptional regulator with XRE-family HTH domain